MKSNIIVGNKDITDLTTEASRSIEKQQWAAVCEHIIKIGDEYLETKVVL